MTLWTKEDSANGAPKFLNAERKSRTYLVDETEAQVASNKAKGLGTPGWVEYRTYTDSDGNTRHKSNVLVAMRVSSVEAGDLGVTGNTTIEDATVADS